MPKRESEWQQLTLLDEMQELQRRQGVVHMERQVIMFYQNSMILRKTHGPISLQKFKVMIWLNSLQEKRFYVAAAHKR